MSNEFRLNNYLSRIGYRGKIEPNLAMLTVIHTRHVDAIPFEGLDPLLHRSILPHYKKSSSIAAGVDIVSSRICCSKPR